MNSLEKVILFIDFDGCMHPFFPEAGMSDEENQFFSYAKNLEKVIVDLKDEMTIQVIISSSWRYRFTLDELKAFFPEGIQDSIVGITPLDGTKFTTLKYNREDECRQYLTNNNENCYWVALDDDADTFYTPYHFFHCPNVFREKEVEQLKEKLRNRNQNA